MFRLPVAIASLALLAGCSQTSGVTATVKNSGSSPLVGVDVIVTGNTYNAGNIPPGQSVSIVVKPQGESHLVIEYSDPTGHPHSLPVDCYFESGYRGSITVEVTGNQIAKVDDQIRIGPY